MPPTWTASKLTCRLAALMLLENAKRIGKPLLAQIMDILRWKTFRRIVARYGGDHCVRTLTCAEYVCILTLAQLTYRENLPDFEASLSAQSAKL